MIPQQHTGNRRQLISTGLAAVPPLLLLLLAYHRRWLSDDAFIDLRVVENLLAGHGPVFNLGERVEAYTNPLWVALLALWGRLGLPLEAGAVALGLTAAIGGLIAAEAGAGRLARLDPPGRERRMLLPLGALVLVALPPVWDFSTSGLETGLAFGWMGAAFWLLARCCTGPAQQAHGICPSWPVAVVLGLGPLIRPDLAIFSAAFLAVLVVARLTADAPARVRGTTSLLVAAALLPLAYQVFRMGYFAALVPNTALAKEAGLADWPRGWAYAWDFVATYALWLPLPLLIGWQFARLARQHARRGRAAIALWLAPVAAGIIHALYVIRLGGDFMHARMLLPSLFGLLLPVMVVAVPVPVAPRRWWQPGAGAVLVLWSLACALALRVPYAGEGNPLSIADERGVYARLSGHPNPIAVSDFAAMPWAQDGIGLAQLASGASASTAGTAIGPRRSLILVNGPWAGAMPLAPGVDRRIALVAVRSNIGLTGYLSGSRVHLVDRLGLADPIAGRLRLTTRGRPGHEKILPDTWVIARFAAPQAVASEPDVEAARQALACGDLASLLGAIEQPLTLGRFARNIGLAWTQRDLRAPADPHAARARFCGE